MTKKFNAFYTERKSGKIVEIQNASPPTVFELQHSIFFTHVAHN